MNPQKYFLLILGLLVLTGALYLLYQSKIEKCQTEDINWDIAIQALSKYYSDSGSTDFGPIDIERHFKENCKKDLQIYVEYLQRGTN